MVEQRLAEILRKVQRIQIVANRAVNDLFAGRYKSVFRGRGMEFNEVREYQPGDDVRTIDWNVTARSGSCFIKRYGEERELTVIFLVDVSASTGFGSTWRSKMELGAEVALPLMFSALKNNDKVGLIQFCDKVLEYLPPRKGKPHVLHMIRQLVSAKPVPRKADLAGALEYLNRVQKRQAVVFVISDFLGVDAWHELAVSTQRHDLTAITLSDPWERRLPEMGLVVFQDAESGKSFELDTGSRRVREKFESVARSQRQSLSRQLRRAGVDELAIDTGSDYVASLRQFFNVRAKRFR